jgi:hypothetical protein
MHQSTKTVGGGAATGLSDDFVNWLKSGLNTGLFGGPSPGGAVAGADPYAATRTKMTEAAAGKGRLPGAIANTWLQGHPLAAPGADSSKGISSILNDILSGGAGNLGGALQKILATQQAGDVGNLRSRYSMGGTGAGTPAAYAESLYRANAAPQASMQIGQLQLQTLLPLLQAMMGLSEKGIPQASTLVEPSMFSQITSGLAGLASGAGSALMGLGPKGAGLIGAKP